METITDCEGEEMTVDKDKVLTAEMKRQLANDLIPHLAWDLSRSDVYSFTPSPTTSAAAVEVFLQQVMSQLRYKIHCGEGFKVAIIPDSKPLVPEYGNAETCL